MNVEYLVVKVQTVARSCTTLSQLNVAHNYSYLVLWEIGKELGVWEELFYFNQFTNLFKKEQERIKNDS